MAELTAASINDLPDSDFAYIEPGGKVVDGKTEPRSLRHFPIHDEAHVRNALARLDQSPFGDKARPKVEAAAKRMSIGGEGKAHGELKAEPMDTSHLDKWLGGKIPRRILMLPFGGPLPGGKAGLDLDGEYFDEVTDIYGPYLTLRQSRERLVDWHHDMDPTGRMKGAIVGHLQFDEQPESDGYWADFWANAGEKRRALIAVLERRGVPLYGSTESVKGARALWPPEADGHIQTWPVTRHTISTSPQNTYAVVPALKAALTASTLDELPADAIKALLVGLDASTLELLLGSSDPVAMPSDQARADAAKAGRVLSQKNMSDLQAAIGLLSDLLARGVLLPLVEQEELRE